MSVTVCHVGDCSFGSIRKTNRRDHVISAIARGISDGLCLHFNDRRTNEKSSRSTKWHISLKNASASLLAIVQPVIGGKISRIDSVVQGQWLMNREQKRFSRCAIGAKRRLNPPSTTVVLTKDLGICPANRLQFVF